MGRLFFKRENLIFFVLTLGVYAQIGAACLLSVALAERAPYIFDTPSLIPFTPVILLAGAALLALIRQRLRKSRA